MAEEQQDSVRVMEMEEPRIGIAVLIEREGKILLGKRKGSHGEGTWALPGGRLGFKEKFEECAKRELLEETGIKADGLKLVSIANDIMYGQHWITLGFSAGNLNGMPILKEPEKCERWEWFSPGNLPEPMFYASRKTIENFIKSRIYKEEDS